MADLVEEHIRGCDVVRQGHRKLVVKFVCANDWQRQTVVYHPLLAREAFLLQCPRLLLIAKSNTAHCTSGATKHTFNMIVPQTKS